MCVFRSPSAEWLWQSTDFTHIFPAYFTSRAMNAPTRSCTSCGTFIPDAALFCLECGEPTPTEISKDPAVGQPSAVQSDENEYRESLQYALGENYELRGLLGRGGFGAVYAAWDRKLEREVAVKVLRYDLFPSPSVIERFEREAKAVAKLTHAHILPVYAVGEGHGLAYMVMPKVEGRTLRSVLDREKPLPVSEAVRITAELAEALQAAHDRGIVHRDVKPENILLDGEARSVQLMDFGIAKATTPGEVGLTGTGMIVGTPPYMSPEQLRGEGDVSPQTDVYALGVVVYEMLAGQLPYDGQSVAELTLQHTAHAVPDLATVREDAPPDLCSVVLRCIAVQRQDRWKTTQQVVDELRGVEIPSDGVVPRGLPTSPIAHLYSFLNQRLTWFAVACAFIAVILWPVAVDQPRGAALTRAEVRRIAHDFFAGMGATGSFAETEMFQSGYTQLLVRALGMNGARHWQDSVLPAERWRVRWVREDRAETWTAALAGDRIIHFDRVPAPEGDDPLTRDSAYAVAESFLSSVGFDVRNLTRTAFSETDTESHPHFDFTWEEQNRSVEYSDAGNRETLTMQVHVEVTGEQVTGYFYWLEIPSRGLPNVSLRYNFRLLGNWFVILLAVVALVQVVRTLIVASMRWKYAVWVGVVGGAAAILVELGEWSDRSYEFAVEEASSARLGVWVMQTTVTGLLVAALFALYTAYGDHVARTYYPKSILSTQRFIDGKFSDRSVIQSLVNGYLLAVVIICIEVVFFAALSYVPGGIGTFVEATFTNFLDKRGLFAQPFVTAVSFSLQAACAVMFAMGLFRVWLRRTWLAAFVLVLIGGWTYVRASPVYFGLVEHSLLAGVMVVAFLRYGGFLTCIVAELVFLLTVGSLGFVTSGLTSLALIGGWWLLVLVALPLVFLEANRRSLGVAQGSGMSDAPIPL